jgi:symplekin
VIFQYSQSIEADLKTSKQLQRTAEPNLNLCRSNHPFLVAAQLEEEANKLLEDCITVLFTSPSPDIISAVIATLTALLKIRPGFGNLIITALTNWTPAALMLCTDAQSKGVEKTVRIALTHLLKLVSFLLARVSHLNLIHFN